MTRRFVFGTVGRLDDREDETALLVLVEATRVLLERGRAVSCLIIGGGGRLPKLRNAAREAHVDESVTFTGRISHSLLAPHYAAIDAFVVSDSAQGPARQVEPTALLEAMATGRPAVVSDVSWPADAGPPASVYLAFRAGDASALARALAWLMDHPSRADELGEAGRRWITTERSCARIGERYREVCADLVPVAAAAQ
jgi:glycosyltransferase involved in cell wall biosynthesis